MGFTLSMGFTFKQKQALKSQRATCGLTALGLLGVFSILTSTAALAECTVPGACQEIPAEKPFEENPFSTPSQYTEDWANYRTKWSRITGFELSGLHWQQFVIVYLNKGREIYKKNYAEYVRFYVEEEDDDDDAHFENYAVGTTFIKENYRAQGGQVGQPLTVTAMIKREPGFDPEHNDWEYIQSSQNGKILLQGGFSDPQIQAVCAECHSNIAERDYIFSTFYSE